jgi:hypothetical protein
VPTPLFSWLPFEAAMPHLLAFADPRTGRDRREHPPDRVAGSHPGRGVRRAAV